MAKLRYVQDSFWTDSYIERCTPDEKLVFIYLLTNPLCNIAGVYEIRSKRIAYETGYDVEVIETILKRLENDKKIIYKDNWIILVNHQKYQSLGNDTAEGINRIIDSSPDAVKSLFYVKTLTNSKDLEYNVLSLDVDKAFNIDPLQTPPFGALGLVKLSKVKLSLDKKKEKSKFGEFGNVLLSEEEYCKLLELNSNNLGEVIEELSGYMESTGKRYKSHYATILNWLRRKGTGTNKNYKQKSISMI